MSPILRMHSIISLGALFLLAGCGGDSYREVDGEWSYVYWNSASGRNVVKLGADRATFRVLGHEYAKDKDSVFYRGRRVRDADPGTFELLSDPIYAKDASHVFVFGHSVIGADPDSFTIIEPPYGKDAVRVYCGTVPMDVGDIDAFEPVMCTTMWSYTYDKKGFLVGKGESFADLEISADRPAVTGRAWARDGVAYYYGPAKVEGADYASFKVLDEYRATDNRHTYRGAFPVEAYPERRRRIRGADR